MKHIYPAVANNGANKRIEPLTTNESWLAIKQRQFLSKFELTKLYLEISSHFKEERRPSRMRQFDISRKAKKDKIDQSDKDNLAAGIEKILSLADGKRVILLTIPAAEEFFTSINWPRTNPACN